MTLAHIYSAQAYHLINTENALSVLAASHLLGDLSDLAHAAFVICQRSIASADFHTWVLWMMQRDVDISSISEKTLADSASRTDYKLALAAHILHHATIQLPHDLHAFSAVQASERHQGYQKLCEIYVGLPFSVFKCCIESRTFPAPSPQAHFNFAKQCIAARKGKHDAEGVETASLAFANGAPEVRISRKAKSRIHKNKER